MAGFSLRLAERNEKEEKADDKIIILQESRKERELDCDAYTFCGQHLLLKVLGETGTLPGKVIPVYIM